MLCNIFHLQESVISCKAISNLEWTLKVSKMNVYTYLTNAMKSTEI